MAGLVVLEWARKQGRAGGEASLGYRLDSDIEDAGGAGGIRGRKGDVTPGGNGARKPGGGGVRLGASYPMVGTRETGHTAGQ